MSHKAKSANLNDFNNNKQFKKKKSNYNNSSISDSYSINTQGNFQLKDNVIKQQDNIKFLKENLNENVIDDKNLIEDINKFLASTDLYGNTITSPYYNNFILNDEILERKVNNILIKNMNLVCYDYFPIFQVYYSKKGKDVTVLNYYKITINDASNRKEFFYLAKKNSIYISFANFIFLLEIKNPKNIEVYINSKNFQKRIKKNLIQDKNAFVAEFYSGEIECENFTLESNKNKIEELKNEIVNDLKGNEVSIESLKKKATEIDILNKNSEKITITLEMLDKELDGFFRIPNNYSLKTVLNTINIEKDSFIILEVKNNDNLELIKKNILHKKSLLLKLGIDPNNVYFFGVLNSEPTPEKKKEINFDETIRKLISQKIIILFPSDLNLLEQKMIEKISYHSEIKNVFEEFEKKIEKNFEEMKNEMKNEMNKITKMIKENK
jgi:hypothetical protein